MKLDLKTSIGRLRLAGTLEAISFLILLGIAVPMKRIFGHPELVPYAGWAHGILLIIYWLLLLIAWLERAIPFRHAVLGFFAALLPFGPFLMERKLKADESAVNGKTE